MSLSKQKVALVVPVYNPVDGWHLQLFNRFEELILATPHIQWKLYIVNDGSTKGINQDIEKEIYDTTLNVFYMQYEHNRGKGFALRFAINSVTEDIIVYTDIDMPFTLNSMQSVVNEAFNHDVAFGIKEKTYYAQLPLVRKIVSRFLQLLIKILFPTLPVADTQCGLKAMNKKAKEIFLATTVERYLFDLEFLWLCSKAKLSLKPIPVILRPGIEFSHMNYKILLQEGRNLMKVAFRKKQKVN